MFITPEGAPQARHCAGSLAHIISLVLTTALWDRCYPHFAEEKAGLSKIQWLPQSLREFYSSLERLKPAAEGANESFTPA